MSNPWQPSPGRGFGSPSYSKPSTASPNQPPLAQPPFPQPPAAPSNSNLLWILLGVGTCGLFSLCCVSGLFVVYFQRPIALDASNRPAIIPQSTMRFDDQSKNPNLGEYRNKIMAHNELLQHVGQIKSLEYSWHETVRANDTEAVGFELKGSIRSGAVIVFESVVDGQTVLRKAVFQQERNRDAELWMAF
ncbi:MAG: hypothetical protein Q8M16_03840 [Pirellulaceae bacterium]|nr:hypothetical protein [Pirellulaceae bacterium]